MIINIGLYYYPHPRGRRVQYLVCVSVSLCMLHKINVKLSYIKIYRYQTLQSDRKPASLQDRQFLKTQVAHRACKFENKKNNYTALTLNTPIPHYSTWNLKWGRYNVEFYQKCSCMKIWCCVLTFPITMLSIRSVHSGTVMHNKYSYNKNFLGKHCFL